MYKIIINPKHTLEDLTKGFDSKYFNSDFKLAKGKKETLEVELVNFGKYMTDQEIKDAMAEKGLELLTIRQALELANQYPNLQKEKWFVTMEGEFYIAFRRWHGGRSVDCDRSGNEFFGHWWVCGVCKSLPLASSALVVPLGLPEILTINGVTYVRK